MIEDSTEVRREKPSLTRLTAVLKVFRNEVLIPDGDFNVYPESCGRSGPDNTSLYFAL